MTLTEFSDEFDIQYDAIAGKSAPGIDLYEKSVYLTKAQLEIVKNYYDASSNRKQKGFEATEKRRVDLKELIKNFKSDEFFKTDDNIHKHAKFVSLPNDLFLVVNEQLLHKKCDLDISVTPVTHDEFNVQIKNPFKQPNKVKAWRLDYSNINDSNTFEIITPYEGNDIVYQMRYLRYPKPIVLTDLDVEFPNEGLTVDGVNTQSPCELQKELHPEILNRAVELAMGDYKTLRLSTKMQLDTRDE